MPPRDHGSGARGGHAVGWLGNDRFALVVEVRGGDRVVRASLVGRQPARATAVGAAAVAEALIEREVTEPGVWLAEQVVDPSRFFARIAASGLTPVIEGPQRGKFCAGHATEAR